MIEIITIKTLKDFKDFSLKNSKGSSVDWQRKLSLLVAAQKYLLLTTNKHSYFSAFCNVGKDHVLRFRKNRLS